MSGVPKATSGSVPEGSSTPRVRVPVGVRASWVVFDLKLGRVVREHRPRQTFRSASVVKILVALDYMWEHRVTAADRALLVPMLRSSDDKAATEFWRRGGQGRIIGRVVRLMGLRDTAPPPKEKPGFWGYTALSTEDVVRAYRYLLEKAPKRNRDFVLEQLSKSTPCGTDGFDQTFGIPRALKRPWAVKQGWSGFGDVPAVPCKGSGARPAVAPDLGIGRPVLHTTGVVGDRVVVVLTLQPAGASFKSASGVLTSLTRQVCA